MSQSTGNPFRLDGQRALVTGASRGIGTAIVEGLAAAGADLVLSARADAELASTARALAERHGVRAETLVADIATTDGVLDLAGRSLEVFDGLDILVNNAGISHTQMVVDVDPDLWDEVMAVNLRAPALLGSRIGKAMADAGTGGAIVNVASAAAKRALTEHYAYCSSKAGLLMTTQMLALELGPHGVRANAVCPTVVMTEMGQRVWGEEEKSAPMLNRIPTGRFAEPSEVADAVVFLAGPGAAMINGEQVSVDGGFNIS